MVSFSQLPAVKKDTIFSAARKFVGPSYFVTALVAYTTAGHWSLTNDQLCNGEVWCAGELG